MTLDATPSGGLPIRQVEPADFARVRETYFPGTREDLGLEYRPEWHWDLDDLQGAYVDHPRHALFVAIDSASGAIVGTTALVNVGASGR